MTNNIFEGRTLVIATKHAKEKVIAPVLEKTLGVKCILPIGFDTDSLGTFTGEIERKDDPIETVRNKCLLAMKNSNCDLAVASEGSFGPHPTMFFVQADDEILMFLDKKNDVEIIVRVLSTETNFNAEEVRNNNELKAFAMKAQFPSHALILKKSKDNFEDIVKGITDWKLLSDKFGEFTASNGSAYVETDMRAMYNPTRMNIIEKATHKLIAKISSLCPLCNAPGLGITAIKEGLPCNLCERPTKSIISHIYECQKCDFTKEELFPNAKETEEPMYCNFCNP